MSKLKAFTLTLVALLLVSVGLYPACGPAPQPPKTALGATLQVVDASIKQACEGLAQALATKGGASAERIIETTCAVENVTRNLREMLLSQQIEAARAAGVTVPSVNSGAFEDRPPEDAAAE